jgi:hypothetical protein
VQREQDAALKMFSPKAPALVSGVATDQFGHGFWRLRIRHGTWE